MGRRCQHEKCSVIKVYLPRVLLSICFDWFYVAMCVKGSWGVYKWLYGRVSASECATWQQIRCSIKISPKDSVCICMIIIPV